MGDYMLSAKEELLVSAVIKDQVHLLWVSVLTGFFLCLLFDLFRAVRRVKKYEKQQCFKRLGSLHVEQCACCCREKRWHVVVEDFIFCAVFVGVTYAIFYRYRSGSPSFYVILCEIAAALVYYAVFHNGVRSLFTIILWHIFTITKWIFGWIVAPFRIICGKMKNFLKNIVKSIKIIIINN